MSPQELEPPKNLPRLKFLRATRQAGNGIVELCGDEKYTDENLVF